MPFQSSAINDMSVCVSDYIVVAGANDITDHFRRVPPKMLLFTMMML